MNCSEIWNIDNILYQIYANLAGFSVFFSSKAGRDTLEGFLWSSSAVESFPIQIAFWSHNLLSLSLTNGLSNFCVVDDDRPPLQQSFGRTPLTAWM